MSCMFLQKSIYCSLLVAGAIEHIQYFPKLYSMFFRWSKYAAQAALAVSDNNINKRSSVSQLLGVCSQAHRGGFGTGSAALTLASSIAPCLCSNDFLHFSVISQAWNSSASEWTYHDMFVPEQAYTCRNVSGRRRHISQEEEIVVV